MYISVSYISRRQKGYEKLFWFAITEQNQNVKIQIGEIYCTVEILWRFNTKHVVEFKASKTMDCCEMIIHSQSSGKSTFQ